jgi:predicted anti-sigma-YlaC factor YlaD
VTSDPFVHYDGAYVLGALDDSERAEFEAHLMTCAACRARVGEVAPPAALLAGLSEADFHDSDVAVGGPPPDTLLPGLLRRAQRQQTRRRAVATSIVAVAAAAVIGLAVAIWPTSSPAGPKPQALTAVMPAPVTATATLVAKRWGTEIDLTCRYTESVEVPRAYGLRVIDTAGRPHDAGTWTLVAGRAIAFTGGTDVARDRIATVQITLPDGTPILQLNV